MRLFLCILWIFLGLGLRAEVRAGGPSDSSDTLKTEGIREVENRAFGLGERLVYSIKYGPIKMGSAVMEVADLQLVDGRTCYRLVSETWSSEAVSFFYEIKDRVESLVDVEGIFSHRIEKYIQEGNYKRDSFVIYDQENHLAFTEKDTVQIPPFVQDILSVFYYMRTQDLRVGRTISVDTYDGGKIYPLNIKVLRKERAKVKAGAFDCLVVEPTLKTGGLLQFRREGKLTIWVTDDERKMPVLLKSKIPIGAVAAELVEYTPGEKTQADPGLQ